MLNIFKRKDLKEHLHETRVVKIGDFRFSIRKINVMDFLDGSKVLKKTYDVYQMNPEKVSEDSFNNNVKKHLVDVLLCGVVKPALSRKDEGEGIWVEEIFADWELAVNLYDEIMSFAYGKKKRFLGVW